MWVGNSNNGSTKWPKMTFLNAKKNSALHPLFFFEYCNYIKFWNYCFKRLLPDEKDALF